MQLGGRIWIGLAGSDSSTFRLDGNYSIKLGGTSQCSTYESSAEWRYELTGQVATGGAALREDIYPSGNSGTFTLHAESGTISIRFTMDPLTLSGSGQVFDGTELVATVSITDGCTEVTFSDGPRESFC